MSLEILLVPAAMAAYAAWQARAEQSSAHCLVETRWRHVGLLELALADMAAQNVRILDDSVTAIVDKIPVKFVRTSDALTAHFPEDTDVEIATDLVGRLDSAYTRRVQDAVYRRIRSRVDKLGFEVVAETVDDDETITLVINVES